MGEGESGEVWEGALGGGVIVPLLRMINCVLQVNRPSHRHTRSIPAYVLSLAGKAVSASLIVGFRASLLTCRVARSFADVL